MYEDFVVRYDSYLTAPCTCDVRFMAPADDGTILYLDNALITYDWFDKGGGGSVSGRDENRKLVASSNQT